MAATASCGSQANVTEHPSAAASSGAQANVTERDQMDEAVEMLCLMAQDYVDLIGEEATQLAACELLISWTEPCDGPPKLSEENLARLSDLMNIMMFTKEGTRKDPAQTLQFMRRCACIREKVGRLGVATEHAVLSEKAVSACYHRFAVDFLENDLLPHQASDRRYRIKRNQKPSTFQRSFIDNILRKSLGHKRVAIRIWQRGLPAIADEPTIRGKVDERVLQSRMEECLTWFSDLVQDLMEHGTQTGFKEQVDLGAKPDGKTKAARERRREAWATARQHLRRAKQLAGKRDSGKRKWDDMSQTEQEMLEDFDTGKLKKAADEHQVKRLKPFRSYR